VPSVCLSGVEVRGMGEVSKWNLEKLACLVLRYIFDCISASKLTIVALECISKLKIS
jgi:hypothetical protein